MNSDEFYFKLLVSAFAIFQLSIGQEAKTIKMDEIHQIFKENYDINKNTTLVLDFEYEEVEIQTSNNNQLHVLYAMEFKNYRKKEIESYIKRPKIESSVEGDRINFSVKTRGSRYQIQHMYEEILSFGGSKKKNEALKKENQM